MLSFENRGRGKRTPRLDVESDKRLGDSLRLGSLLLVVLSQALSLETLSLSILLLVTAEEVDVLITAFLLLLGLDSHVDGLGAVGTDGLAGIAGEGGELILERGDVLVPTGSVGVLLGVGGTAQGLVDGNISLRGRVAIRGILSARSV